MQQAERKQHGTLERIQQVATRHEVAPVTTKVSAFSMAELMIAVVILGIGLLITSSMFPIAWYKAKDVAEATDLVACANSAELMAKQLLIVNKYDSNSTQLCTNYSSFVPGDWVPPAASSADPVRPVLYPDTRVHHLNLGNLLYEKDATNHVDEEGDPFDSSLKIPVADNTWTLDDGLAAALNGDSAFQAEFAASGLYLSKVTAQARLFPPLPGDTPVFPADANDISVEFAQWNARFESRRYCWSIFYRFEEMPGPNGSTGSVFNNGTLAQRQEELETTLERPRLLTVYYFMLKRRTSARYARQSGIDCTNNCDWPEATRPVNPRALAKEEDVRLPVPWLIEAKLTQAPVNGAPASGVPSEISSSDAVVMSMLQVGSVLLDNRTGTICRVVTMREIFDGDTISEIVYTLDREYTFDDLFFNQREPMKAGDADWKTVADNNWALYWDIATGSGAGPDGVWSEVDKKDFLNDYENIEVDPQRRFYWVFPPPVEGARISSGVPAFDGTQPVVGVEVRQMVVEP